MHKKRNNSVSFNNYLTFLERDENTKDKAGVIITAIRDMLRQEQSTSMNANEILKRFSRSHLSTMKIAKEDLMETLNYYKNLSIVYVDEEENVVFL